MAAAPRIWLLIGDKLGDNAQARAVVAALGWPYEVRQVFPKPEWVLGKPKFEPGLDHLDLARSVPLGPPWPDLIVTGEFVTGTGAGTFAFGRLANQSHWLIHRGQQEGFAMEADRWDLPAGGLRDFGFNATFGTGSAIGDESWARRGRDGEAPGEIETARIRGARVQASGRAAVVDEDEVPVGDELLDVALDARCDAEDD